MTHDELLDALFAAIVAGDIDAVGDLYAPGVEVWNNASRRTFDRAGSLRLLRAFRERAGAVRYEVQERRHWENGAMQRHVLHVQTDEVADHEIDVCMAFAFADGRITRVFEYLNGRALVPLGW
jgi:ketosteroid isomerase-like protein